MAETVNAAGIAHRKLQALHTFWCQCAEHGLLPRRSAIVAESFKPWMGHMMIIEPVGARPRFRVRLHGICLYGYHGRDLTGWFLDDVADEPALSRIVSPYRAAVEACGAQHDIISPPFSGGTIRSLCRLVLPCAEDGTSVDRLIVGMYLNARPSDAGGPASRPPRGGAQAPVRV